MGQSDSRVNIWQWKAAIERTARTAGDPYNGTRNLTSNGICKAVETEGVPPTANSTWQDGRWYVVYTRDLAPAGEGTAPLEPGENTNAAFAVWDGGNGETRGMKGVTTWIGVTIEKEATNAAANWVTMLITALAAAGSIALARRMVAR
jgi:DMSO reductase family type II enzyme heme b subunit